MMNSSTPPRPHNVQAALPYPDGQHTIGNMPSATCRRSAIAPLSVSLAMLLALLMTLLGGESVLAQGPRNFRIPPYVLPDVESPEAEAATVPDRAAAPRNIIVDTDPGVDDAVALVWLFSQSRYEVNILGIVTVAGNTSIENATLNAKLIREWLGETNNVPVIQGASGPLQQALSLAQSLIHGPDGLWFVLQGGPPPLIQPPNPADSSDAVAFYCSQATPGLLILALGPLTNIAMAMEACPNNWEDVEVVSVGGGKFKFNQTPVTEYNYWQDPEAAALVTNHTVSAGAFAPVDPLLPTLQIVLADAFSQFEIEQRDMRQLERKGGVAIQNLLPALGAYMFSLSQGGEPVGLPDVSAAIYALENGLGTAQSALVEVLAGVPEVARGQTVIGLGDIEKIVMIAGDAVLSDLARRVNNGELTPEDLQMEMGMLLFSRPDNAMIVTDIEARRMHNIFLQEIRDPRNSSTNEETGVSSAMEDFENHLFVPLVSD